MELLALIFLLIGIGALGGLIWGLLRAVPPLARVLSILAGGVGRGFMQGWREKRGEKRPG